MIIKIMRKPKKRLKKKPELPRLSNPEAVIQFHTSPFQDFVHLHARRHFKHARCSYAGRLSKAIHCKIQRGRIEGPVQMSQRPMHNSGRIVTDSVAQFSCYVCCY